MFGLPYFLLFVFDPPYGFVLDDIVCIGRASVCPLLSSSSFSSSRVNGFLRHCCFPVLLYLTSLGFPPCFVSPCPCLASVVHRKCKSASDAKSLEHFGARAWLKYKVSPAKEAFNRCIITSSFNGSNVVISCDSR